MRQRHVWLVTGVALLLSVSGCTAGSTQEQAGRSTDTPKIAMQPSASPSGGTDAGGDRLHFAVVTHGTAGDPFWDVVKTGAEDAGKAQNVDIDYQSAGDPGVQAQLIDAAVSGQIDGLVVSMADPDALHESITRAEAAGVPVVTINSGGERSQEFGALTHVGQSELIAGQGAGGRLRDAGVTKLVCVVHEAGNIGLEQRCQGAAQTLGGQVENLQVSINNLTEAQTTIASELQADPSIDGVLTLNPAVAMAAAAAISSSNSTATLATFDLNGDVVQAIKDGQILFAVDQQQYLQGYLPVVFLALFDRNANVVGGGQPVLTGPAYVTKDNADTVEQLAAAGTR